MIGERPLDLLYPYVLLILQLLNNSYHSVCDRVLGEV